MPDQSFGRGEAPTRAALRRLALDAPPDESAAPLPPLPVMPVIDDAPHPESSSTEVEPPRPAPPLVPPRPDNLPEVSLVEGLPESPAEPQELPADPDPMDVDPTDVDPADLDPMEPALPVLVNAHESESTLEELFSPSSPEFPTSPPQSAPPAHSPEPPQPANTQPSSHKEQRDRHSFLLEEHRDEPARMGVRGTLNKVGFTFAPGPFEQSIRDNELLVSQRWPGPRTIAVVNGKGGAGKTPTTALLSAVFARYGGAGVLAWDNNQTRGTLGWRTETGPHEHTLLELLPETGRLLSAGAQSADLAQYVHHQPGEKYDVLRSKPIRLASENRLSPADIDAIYAVAARFYRLIVIDSGNDESDPMWLRMIDHADQLVVATTTRSDHAEAGALLLEALEERDERSAHLAREAVVVVTQADPRAAVTDVQHVVAGYQDLAREVVTIPFDQEMVDGHLRLGGLSPVTQHAWLAAGAAVARGL